MRNWDRREDRKQASLDANDKSMYLAWQVESATQVCRLEDQEIGAPQVKEKKPCTERAASPPQFASTYVVIQSLSGALEEARIGRERSAEKQIYDITCSNADQWDELGAMENQVRKFTAKVISGREP